MESRTRSCCKIDPTQKVIIQLKYKRNLSSARTVECIQQSNQTKRSSDVDCDTKGFKFLPLQFFFLFQFFAFFLLLCFFLVFFGKDFCKAIKTKQRKKQIFFCYDFVSQYLQNIPFSLFPLIFKTSFFCRMHQLQRQSKEFLVTQGNSMFQSV